jgi:hypothetical protein
MNRKIIIQFGNAKGYYTKMNIDGNQYTSDMKEVYYWHCHRRNVIQFGFENKKLNLCGISKFVLENRYSSIMNIIARVHVKNIHGKRECLNFAYAKYSHSDSFDLK